MPDACTRGVAAPAATNAGSTTNNGTTGRPVGCCRGERGMIGQAEIPTKPHHDTAHTGGSLAYGVASCPIL